MASVQPPPPFLALTPSENWVSAVEKALPSLKRPDIHQLYQFAMENQEFYSAEAKKLGQFVITRPRLSPGIVVFRGNGSFAVSTKENRQISASCKQTFKAVTDLGKEVPFSIQLADRHQMDLFFEENGYVVFTSPSQPSNPPLPPPSSLRDRWLKAAQKLMPSLSEEKLQTLYERGLDHRKKDALVLLVPGFDQKIVAQNGMFYLLARLKSEKLDVAAGQKTEIWQALTQDGERTHATIIFSIHS